MEQLPVFKIIEGTAEEVEAKFNEVCDQYMVIGSWVFWEGGAPMHSLHLSLIKPRSNITRLPTSPLVS